MDVPAFMILILSILAIVSAPSARRMALSPVQIKPTNLEDTEGGSSPKLAQGLARQYCMAWAQPQVMVNHS